MSVLVTLNKSRLRPTGPQMHLARNICEAKTVLDLLAAMTVPESKLLRELVDLTYWVRPLNVLNGAMEAILFHHASLIAVWDGRCPPKPRIVPVDLREMHQAIAQVSCGLIDFESVKGYGP